MKSVCRALGAAYYAIRLAAAFVRPDCCCLGLRQRGRLSLRSACEKHLRCIFDIIANLSNTAYHLAFDGISARKHEGFELERDIHCYGLRIAARKLTICSDGDDFAEPKPNCKRHRLNSQLKINTLALRLICSGNGGHLSTHNTVVMRDGPVSICRWLHS